MSMRCATASHSGSACADSKSATHEGAVGADAQRPHGSGGGAAQQHRDLDVVGMGEHVE